MYVQHIFAKRERDIYPSVTISVHIPIFCPLSLAKNVSVTTALLIAMAGEMKKAVKSLVTT
jgi:hypothetical protein